MLYRIITENKNKAIVENRVKKLFSGFTIIEATSYWQGQKENSLIIEIDSFSVPARQRIDILIMKLAKEIKAINSQDAVMVQRLSSKTVLI